MGPAGELQYSLPAAQFIVQDASIKQYGTRMLEENSPTRRLKTSSLIHESLGMTGLSILGGEPTEYYNIGAAIKLAKRFKEEFPNKDIWLWSGRLKEDIDRLQHRKRTVRFNRRFD
jgi:organic radical activating enzyme